VGGLWVRVGLAAVLALASSALPVAASADAVSAAQQRASAAAAEVDALLDRYQRAEQQVDVGVARLSQAFSLAASAEVSRDEAREQARRAQARRAIDVRAVYADGGPAGITGSVLTAGSPDDALWRASTATRIMGTLLRDNRTAAEQRQAAAVLEQRRAELTQRATQQQADALKELKSQADRAGTALSRAQLTLTRLDAAARRAKAVRDARRRLAEARRAAAEARAEAMGPVTAIGIPADYEQAYRAAAITCPGMDWPLLAAVGQVESGHGRDNGPSSAGAVGPMQFLPRTFQAFAVDGDDDGVTDPWDPQDAIFTAAHYLCVSGAAGGSAAGVHAALLAYNHAEWYVQLVLAAERSISSRAA
jgi:membrane-bound lytic murein transglycosylase B